MNNYKKPEDSNAFLPSRLKTDYYLDFTRKKNNPKNEPVGDFTGRCKYCGSNDLWDDNLAYGCNSCKALLGSN